MLGSLPLIKPGEGHTNRLGCEDCSHTSGSWVEWIGHLTTHGIYSAVGVPLFHATPVTSVAPDAAYNLVVSGPEFEVIVLALVTLLATDEAEGDIFEPGFKGITVGLAERLRSQMFAHGLTGIKAPPRVV